MRKNLMLLLVLVMTIISACSRQPKSIKLIADTVYIEVGEEISEAIADYIEAEPTILAECILDLSKVDIYQLGTYPGVVIYDNQEYIFNIVVSEVTIPVFTGLTDLVIQIGEMPDYLEDVMAFDQRDGDLTDKIKADDSDVNYQQEGSYEVYYTVLDSDGNNGQAVRNVIVIDNEETITIPEINGVQDFIIQKDGALPEDLLAGVTASDRKDGDLTSQLYIEVPDIDFSAVGSQFNIYYSVENSSGNIAEVISIVTIVE